MLQGDDVMVECAGMNRSGQMMIRERSFIRRWCSRVTSNHQVSTLTFYLTCSSLHSNDRSLGSASLLAMNHSHAIIPMEPSACSLFLSSLVSLFFRVVVVVVVQFGVIERTSCTLSQKT